MTSQDDTITNTIEWPNEDTRLLSAAGRQQQLDDLAAFTARLPGEYHDENMRAGEAPVRRPGTGYLQVVASPADIEDAQAYFAQQWSLGQLARADGLLAELGDSPVVSDRCTVMLAALPSHPEARWRLGYLEDEDARGRVVRCRLCRWEWTAAPELPLFKRRGGGICSTCAFMPSTGRAPKPARKREGRRRKRPGSVVQMNPAAVILTSSTTRGGAQ